MGKLFNDDTGCCFFPFSLRGAANAFRLGRPRGGGERESAFLASRTHSHSVSQGRARSNRIREEEKGMKKSVTQKAEEKKERKKVKRPETERNKGKQQTTL